MSSIGTAFKMDHVLSNDGYRAFHRRFNIMDILSKRKKDIFTKYIIMITVYALDYHHLFGYFLTSA